ncbi:MAG: formimidoylglutamate deiminase [Rudaea sp.]|uniref:formimidoylglutamate deiminase n=1 Tax=Rudaea sp. TaxID=2136325 RepID=UPI0039E2E83E
MKSYVAESLWSPQGWTRDARIAVDAGRVVAAQGEAGERLGRYVLPGMPNLHSHAFQRAMAGLAEKQIHPAVSNALFPDREGQKAAVRDRTSQQSDSFWTWRETMYTFANRIGPDDLRAIAAQLYVEMLKAGYTHVCEFHYLHHRPDGKPYADPAAMSLALVEAARETGIGLTLLPTLYLTGGFDGRALSERQRRFGLDVDAYLSLLQQLAKMENAALRIGVALHSLRAVPERAMREVLAAGETRAMPIHIHIAEQIGEVQDCLALRNARPVEWLLDNLPVDARWCLVHATHMSAQETQRLAQSGAVAGLCPTTEANLGDGLFPLKAYFDDSGALGIGSDSHISVSPVEELRWLEYGQRLATRHRNIAVSAANRSVGETLYAAALRGGAQAAGVAIGAIEPGARADLVVLDEAAPQLAGRDEASLVDTFLFAGNANLVRHVMANGDWAVRDFRHRDEERIAARYRETVARLASQVY